MPEHVLIIGGGVGGLCLAQGLKKNGISFHIYERDRANNYRFQGYRIRLAREAVEALQYVFTDELWAEFKETCAVTRLGPIPGLDAISGVEAVEPVFNINTAGVRTDSPEYARGAANVFTADRTMFRELAMKGLEGQITYGKDFARYERGESGVTAHFKDGSSAQGTLLVGADGARSPVRKQYLPENVVLDTGGRCIYGKTPLTPELVQSIHPATMKRMSAIKDSSNTALLSTLLEPITFSNRQKLEVQGWKVPHDYFYWVMASQPATFDMPEEDVPRLSSEQSADLAVKMSEKWHESLRPIIDNQDRSQTSVLRVSSAPPNLPNWEPNQHLTLIGDAIHQMSPAAGSGAITALRDSHHLCQLIVEEGLSKNTIGKYESMMREYASDIIEKSSQGGRKLFDQKPWDQCLPIQQ